MSISSERPTDPAPTATAVPVAQQNAEPDTGRRPAEQYVSIPLYVAGAVAQIAGLAAVSVQVANDNWTFAWFTIGLTILGMGTSYMLRRIGAPVRLLKAGVALLGLVFVSALRSGGIFGAIVPAEALGSQEMLLVSALAFTATFCSFLLVTDEAVVFTCVWSIAIIGLTGTVNIDRELIICFMVFLLAAAFLLVHQNGLASGLDSSGVLRRRDDGPAGQNPMAAYDGPDPATDVQRRSGHAGGGSTTRGRGSLVKAQLRMAAAAWIGSLIIGCVVAIPIQMIGRNLSLATIIQRLRVPSAAAAIQRRLGGSERLNFENLTQFAVGLGPVDDDPTEKLTVTSDRACYWRGRIFDKYTGKGWVNSDVVEEQTPFALHSGTILRPSNAIPNAEGFNVFDIPQANQPIRHKVLRQTNHFHVDAGLFSPIYHAAEPLEVRAPASEMFLRPDNTLGTRFADGYDYEVVSDVSTAAPKDLRGSSRDYPKSIRNEYIYQNLDNDTLLDLAQQITTGVPNDPYDRAEAIRSWVATHSTYTLDARAVPAADDAAEFFLTTSHEGYCDLYATATTLLCRYAGIPARVVTGFAPGTPSDTDRHKYILRGSDEHAWTEVYFEGYGWIPFDATEDTNGTVIMPQTPQPIKTPSLWERLLQSGTTAVVLTLIGAGGVLYVMVNELSNRFRSRRLGARPGRVSADESRDAMVRLYVSAVRRVSRHARLAFTETVTPAEFERQVRDRLGAAVADALAPLTRAVQLASYAEEPPDPATISAARSAMAKIRAAMRSTPRYHEPGGRSGTVEHTDASAA